jgi:hypothetical protein
LFATHGYFFRDFSAGNNYSGDNASTADQQIFAAKTSTTLIPANQTTSAIVLINYKVV